jgi:glycosyltransferase involved in cell wall biosynthesis
LIGNDDPFSLRKKSLLWKIEGKALPRCDRIICKSSAIKNICLSENISPHKLAAIPNGTDLKRFLPASDPGEVERMRRELALPENAFVVTFVGRIGARKGCDLLFEAWEEVIKHTPDGLLLLIGPYREDEAATTESSAFRRRVQSYLEHQRERRVVFLGEARHEQVAQYLRLSDCFVFPSQREGLPNGVIEAMASGLAVICSDIPGVTTDLIEHGVDGLLLKTRNPQELAEMIMKLRKNESLRRRLAANAAQKARSKFSIDVVAEQHRQMYHELLREKNAGRNQGKGTRWN